MLQDLKLLVDHGAPAASVETCATECWGATLGGDVAVARSALGIRDDGQLVWAAGESLSPAALARALTDAGVQRAVELDINPEWVAGYLYVHPLRARRGARGPRPDGYPRSPTVALLARLLHGAVQIALSGLRRGARSARE